MASLRHDPLIVASFLHLLRGDAKRSRGAAYQGLKPGSCFGALRGAKAPLFHGCAFPRLPASGPIRLAAGQPGAAVST